MDRIILHFCTGNRNKFSEMQSLFSIYLPNVELRQLPIEGLPEIQGTAKEVVLAKCKEAQRQHPEKNIMVEDTALYISCFRDNTQAHSRMEPQGLPGPYIKDFERSMGNHGIAHLANYINQREAIAQCNIAVGRFYHQEPILATGNVEGTIVEPAGYNGFGWDQIFKPNTHEITFAQMDMEVKNGISHRMEAVKSLSQYFN